MDNYVEFCTTRGRLTSRSGSRSLDAGELLVFSSHELICRFEQDLANGIDSSVRVVIDNRFFTVTSWELIDEKNFYYRFQMNESK
jgi:hypothetical protein